VLDGPVLKVIQVRYVSHLADAIDEVLDAPAKTRHALAGRLGGLVSIKPAP
jgi:hypothetical protein